MGGTRCPNCNSYSTKCEYDVDQRNISDKGEGTEVIYCFCYDCEASWTLTTTTILTIDTPGDPKMKDRYN